MEKYDTYKGWMRPKKEMSSIDEILNLWNKINYTTTERNYDSINVSKSDTIYSCENVYRSQDCRECKNTIFSGYLENNIHIDHQKRSMGIGLSVCASIIKAHEGSIMVEDAPDGGCVFRFTLTMEEDMHE